MSRVLYYLYPHLVTFSSSILAFPLLLTFLLIRKPFLIQEQPLFFVTTPVVPSVTLYFASLRLAQSALNLNLLLLVAWINNNEKLSLFFITLYFLFIILHWLLYWLRWRRFLFLFFGQHFLLLLLHLLICLNCLRFFFLSCSSCCFSTGASSFLLSLVSFIEDVVSFSAALVNNRPYIFQ